LSVEAPSVVRARPSSVIAVGLVLVVAYVVVVSYLSGTISYEIWGGLVVGPLLIAVSLPFLAREARRQSDHRLFGILMIALVLKVMAGAIGRYYVTYVLYHGKADVDLYYIPSALKIAANFRAGHFVTGLPSLTDSDFIRLLSGIVYTVTGPTRLGAFMAFSWLGFWGLFFFYKAFVIAVPGGNRRMYALLVFFLPSLIFWPSTIGKDAWMMLALGIGSYGAALILTGRAGRGLPTIGLGVWLGSLVRPHIMAMLAVGLVAAYLIRRSDPRLRELGPVVKGLAIVMLAALAVVLLLRTQSFLKTSFLQSGLGTSALENLAANSSDQGTSTFNPSVLTSPVRAPVAIITVLFRPFPNEADNAQSLVAGLEGTALLLLSLARFRSMWAAFRTARDRPYLALAIVYAAMFVIGFSSVANFGLLARERAQVLPFYVMFLCIPPVQSSFTRFRRATPAGERIRET
jgi:hypothetical protein